jgi:predicted component of type VI protein secretion system
MQNGLAIIKKGATSKIRTGDRQARAAEVKPLGLRQTVVKEAIAVLFNRGKAGKLTPT